jgi:hypothetical protein
MPHAWDVVVCVKVCVASVVVEPHTLSTDEMERIFVKQPVSRAE